MKHEYSMRYRRVELLPLTQEASEQLRVLRNSCRECFVTSTEISAAAQERWFQNYLQKPDDYMFSIYHAQTGKWIGAVGVYDLDIKNKRAEFGRLLIDKTETNESGLGTDATICACKIAFSMFKIEHIELEVYVDNIPAQITYLKSGFIPEEMFFDEEGRRMLRMKREEL